MKDSTKIKINEMEWVDFREQPTIALSVDKDDLINISELIELLEEAKKRWGDIPVLAQEQNSGHMGGFGCVYLNHGYDLREQYGDDYISPDMLVLFS